MASLNIRKDNLENSQKIRKVYSSRRLLRMRIN
jgi:hypothetical protein